MIRYLVTISVAVLLCGVSSAELVTHTSFTDFTAALPGSAQFSTLNFDSQANNTTISDGQSLEGITFNYDFGGTLLNISNQFTTSSAPNFLGTTDFNMLQDGDDFSFSFDAANGVGLNFITADTMEDGDITLSFGGESASLVAADLQQTLSDGSKVYFLGVSDVANTFASATVTTNGGGMFLYNVDDIVLARSTPEPTGFLLFGIGIGLTSCSRRRR